MRCRDECHTHLVAQKMQPRGRTGRLFAPARDQVDPAAVPAAAFAAALSLVFNRDEWSWLTTLIGGALALLLGGYAFLPPAEWHWWKRVLAMGAVAATGALCLTLAVAYPAQEVLRSWDVNLGGASSEPSCRESASAAVTAKRWELESLRAAQGDAVAAAGVRSSQEVVEYLVEETRQQRLRSCWGSTTTTILPLFAALSFVLLVIFQLIADGVRRRWARPA